MNKKRQTKEIVEEIKKIEEERYGIELDIETPTVIEYYRDNIKKGEFSLKNNTPYSFISRALEGLNSGLAIRAKDKAIVFDRNSRLSEFNIPIKYLGIPLENIFTTETTYHEIAHLLQFKNKMYPYELFCSNILSNHYGDLKYDINRKQHDSYYNEMSANFYGWSRARKHFEHNEKAVEYIDLNIGKYGVQKCTYDFDENLEKYQTLFESNGNKTQHYGFQLDIWNEDGTFKKPREIINSEKFNKKKNDSGFIEFYSRVLGSKAYLSRLNIEKLDADEINFVITAIDNNNAFLYLDSGKIEEFYAHQMIDKNTYEKAIKELDEKINEKNEFKKLIKKHKQEKEIANSNRADIMPVLEYGENLILEKEEPKKVKNKSESKSELKKLIDEFSNFSIKWLTLYAEMAIVPSMFLEGGPNNPIVGAAITATGIAAGGIAVSKLQKYNQNGKNR